jgi:hypothetical protein
MFNGIYSYVFGEVKDEIEPDKNTLDNRHQLLKEIIIFKTDLLKSHTPPKKKNKLYKYRRKNKKKPYQIPVPSFTEGNC